MFKEAHVRKHETVRLQNTVMETHEYCIKTPHKKNVSNSKLFHLCLLIHKTTIVIGLINVIEITAIRIPGFFKEFYRPDSGP